MISLPSIARLSSELNDLDDCELKGISAGPVRKSDKTLDYYNWEGSITGLAGSYYEGGKIKFKLVFSSDYPEDAPEVVFTPPLYHPRVLQTAESPGHMCVPCLQAGTYKSGVKLGSVLAEILDLVRKPEGDTDLGIAKVLKNDPEAFKAKCQEWVKTNCLAK